MRRNHHTHTPRCGHAVGSEQEYIEAALSADYAALGFSDHSPWPRLHSPGIRMDESMLPDYVNTVKALKEEYKGHIHISTGLECEFFPAHMSWLKDTRDAFQLDYLIFGNHFDLDEETGMYFGGCRTHQDIRRYMRTTLDGLATGMYAWLAHPDLFLRSYREFDAVCQEAAREICRAATALRIPLEFNLLGLRIQHEKGFAGLGYPYRPFWEIAAEENSPVIMNVDAHDPKHLADTTYYDLGIKEIQSLGLRPFDLMDNGLVQPLQNK